MNLWREPIVFRKVLMAFPFYLIKYNVWAEHCFVYSRYRGTSIFLMFWKAPPTGRECNISIIQSAVFGQTNAKIHPHKPVLNNIIIYTSDSSLFLKKLFKRLNCGVYNLFIFVKTCISMVNQLLFRGLQHEIIKVSSKWINVNKRTHYKMYMKNLEILDTTMGHHCAAASITTKRNLKVDLGKCVQMYRAPNSLNAPLSLLLQKI